MQVPSIERPLNDPSRLSRQINELECASGQDLDNDGDIGVRTADKERLVGAAAAIAHPHAGWQTATKAACMGGKRPLGSQSQSRGMVFV